jgi:hypothetical protein
VQLPPGFRTVEIDDAYRAAIAAIPVSRSTGVLIEPGTRRLLIALRHRLRLTQSDLASLLPTPQAQLCRWETGHTFPRRDSWLAWITALELVTNGLRRPKITGAGIVRHLAPPPPMPLARPSSTFGAGML